jgi:hypothetical protein
MKGFQVFRAWKNNITLIQEFFSIWQAQIIRSWIWFFQLQSGKDWFCLENQWFIHCISLGSHIKCIIIYTAIWQHWDWRFYQYRSFVEPPFKMLEHSYPPPNSWIHNFIPVIYKRKENQECILVMKKYVHAKPKDVDEEKTKRNRFYNLSIVW